MSIGTYGVNGTVTDTSSRTISVTFKAGGLSVVLTWGVDIATRKDWGDNMSAVAISGSSYHVALDSFTDSNGNALGPRDSRTTSFRWTRSFRRSRSRSSSL